MSLGPNHSIALILAGLLLASAGLTWLLRHARALDIPNLRSSHVRSVPRLGGLAIVVPYLAGIAAAAIILDGAKSQASPIAVSIAAATGLAVVGLLDDLQRLTSFRLKLGAQLLAAVIVASTGLHFGEVSLPFAGTVQMDAVGYILTVLWLVGLANAVNFMDGLDGLVGGTCLIVAVIFGGLSLAAGGTLLPMAFFLLAPCILGFVVFNFPRASIFMGDVGSQFLGFLLAALAVAGAQQEPSPIPLFVMPLLLFHFIFDTVFTCIRRLINGENVAEAHRSHLYQLLNRLGASHARVSLIHYAAAAIQGAGALVLIRIDPSKQILVFVPFVVLETVYAVIVVRLARRRGLIPR